MDPSLRVAANDPHLVSLGGGRLSTAVTIHYIPIGTTTVGSSPACTISLNGPGIKSMHCTIYRNADNHVCMEPEQNARTLIDGQAIFQKTNLTQGAMVTIGNSYYLRFNNPQEAQMIRSVIGLKEDNSDVAKNRNEEEPVNGRLTTQTIDTQFLNSIIESDLDSKVIIDDWNNVNNINKQNVWNNKDDDHQRHHNNQYQQSAVYNNLAPADINSLQCPKVFKADSVTVNMPAKDVLGQKYVNFAKNLIENHRSEKNVTNALLNNQVNNTKLNTNNNLNEMKLNNIPNNYIGIGMPQLGTNSDGGGGSSGGNGSANNANTNTHTNNKTEYLVKVNNTIISRDRNVITNSYDVKPGAYETFQMYPLNDGVNSDMNVNQSVKSVGQRLNGINESERLEDMLKICSEYADRQNQQHKNAMTLSPIVQNRIKTNGSLPREKKSPFNYDFTNGSSSGSVVLSAGQLQQQPLINNNKSPRIDVREAQTQLQKTSSGYENVVLGVGGSGGVGKYIPQSPRTKIRTTCLSPKRENFIDKQTDVKKMNHNHYEQLIKTFEEKFNFDMKTNEECTRSPPPPSSSPQKTQTQMPLQTKKTNKNINNLTLNLMLHSTPKHSPELCRKPIPAPRTLQQQKAPGNDESTNDLIKNFNYTEEEQLNTLHKDLIARVNYLKSQITDLQKHENGREFSTKINVNSRDLQAILPNCMKNGLENQLQMLQNKMYRLEAQRNATRVMEENKQAKLKQSIEMKQDQICRLKKLLEQNPTDTCYREELNNVSESLENDRKAFEDLEFQYLEEESEWHAYCEELHAEEKALLLKIEENRFNIEHLERNDIQNKSVTSPSVSAPVSASASVSASLSLSSLHDIDCLNKHLANVLHELQRPENHTSALEPYKSNQNNKLKFKQLDKSTEKNTIHCEDDRTIETKNAAELKVPLEKEIETDASINQSLFGSTEIIYFKHDSNNIPNVMSRSVNDNILYNYKNIELPSSVTIDDSIIALTLSDNKSNLHNTNHTMSDSSNYIKNNSGNMGTYKLFMGYDNYEVNVLDRKTPSQDDIDRISKLTVETPISTKDPTTKIFDSIKEIERNRQLLLTQQGHHVIEHERQKMNDLKKKINNEARAQYISKVCQTQQSNSVLNEDPVKVNNTTQSNKENIRKAGSVVSCNRENFTQRHSNPELERNHSALSNKTRPLSEANSEISCEILSENNLFKSGDELSTDDGCNLRKACETFEKRSDSVNSSDISNADFNGSVAVIGRKKQLAKYQRPLTRYLPISSPDLNLRKHIESAGHQISLCPHVFVDAYSCRGYLHKLGATFHGWSKRWFVLDRQCNAFIYYADKSERKPRGGAYFTTIDEVYLDHLNASKSSRPHCTFIVKTKKRSFHLQAASSAAARIWIDALITGAQGNLIYYMTNHNNNSNNTATTTTTLTPTN